ncbi:hypothetical protein CSW31_02040, partial [Thermus scotoductus]
MSRGWNPRGFVLREGPAPGLDGPGGPGLIPFLVVFFVHDRGRPPDPERAVAEGQEGQGPDREAPLSGRLP